ncbi:MAG TPA: hypothetical protein VNV87_04535 [Acidimicrobiales bacterium]|jgi:hypothetical protein|nr:hypothetical protein [Acidimicrobiales bacterium]
MSHDGTHGDQCFGCRIKSVSLVIPAFRPHFNHSVGKYVSTSRDFDEALRRGAEEQNSSYSRIDPGDYASLTPSTDTEIIETQARNLHDRRVQ